MSQIVGTVIFTTDRSNVPSCMGALLLAGSCVQPLLSGVFAHRLHWRTQRTGKPCSGDTHCSLEGRLKCHSTSECPEDEGSSLRFWVAMRHVSFTSQQKNAKVVDSLLQKNIMSSCQADS
ncbi:unnamed protein product [Durusdinium trenchii]|uniref:Uncharacterized protein n=1 Tax=Durusdinium trenchii TaxID=1381693 RepID=A0ABP0JP53_9DINO